jgi:hypothetical protein
MQMFLAEVSNPIEKADFERSWGNDSAINPNLKVTFLFTGRKISATVESGTEDRWQSEDFHRTFASAVRRIDRNCNIRWL